MNRRTFLAASTALGTTAVAGCLDQALGTPPRAPPTVSGRPDAVYIPSHKEGMKMVGTKPAGDYQVGLMFSYAHRFWNITGSNLKKTAPEGDVHLMASAWDPETGTVLPVGNAQAEITKDGDSVVGGRPMWPMLSQRMGFHFGDNFALDGNGTYEVTVDVDPPGATPAGGFAGKFGDGTSATFTFDYSKKERDQIAFTRLDDRQGEKAALAPMDMSMPLSRLPKRGGLPGDLVGQGESGDGVFYVKTLDAPPEGFDGEGTYLYVSARTPYNRYPLPKMALQVEVPGDDGDPPAMTEVLHPDTGYHYGRTVPDLSSGDEVTLSVGAPPQVSRHEGYETAFMSFDDISITA